MQARTAAVARMESMMAGDDLLRWPSCVAGAAATWIIRSGSRAEGRAEWDRIRRSPDVDAFVLNWIVGHVTRPGYTSGRLVY